MDRTLSPCPSLVGNGTVMLGPFVTLHLTTENHQDELVLKEKR